MNFFGHAAVAAETTTSGGAPRFVLGAMLPDLLEMARLQLVCAGDAEVEAGIAHHHRVDAVFHDLPTFVGLQREARRDLGGAGLRRGSALAVAHVGVELLLDGVLHEHGEGIGAYRRALQERPPLRFTVHDGCRRFDALCRRIGHTELAASYGDPVQTGQRLYRILSRRPRLALREPEVSIVTRWLEQVQPRVQEKAQQLLFELRQGLSSQAS